ncbi:MAG: IS21 family transposase [Firmicutes bacterium]|nr:IS21 family transposase [Bacillota bacterium]
MANKQISMLRTRQLIQLLERGVSQRKISLQLRMSRNIVSTYAVRIRESGKSYQELLALDDATLSFLLSMSSVHEAVPDERFSSLEPLLPGYAKELKRTGVTKLLLWEEYRTDYSEGYGYTQFKHYLNRYIKGKKYSYHHVHIPGQEMQVDFAGDYLYITDKGTGEQIACPVLVCTLPYSGQTFAIGLRDARQESFYYGLNKSLEYFGGVTESVKSDNMRQWVKRADRYEPTFNDATVQWAIHYQTNLIATRPGKPTDKGHVESHVNIVYRRVYARMRNEVFYSLQALNSKILELLDKHNNEIMQGRSYSRNQRFIQEEIPLLKPLPQNPFVFKYRKDFTVNSTYYVQITHDQHFYSVPHQYVGQKATLIYDYENVEIYVSLERVAYHRRSYITGDYTTIEEHLPERHRAYKRSQEYNAAYYLRQALRIGPSTKEAVQRVLSSNIFIQQGYRSCMGIISLTKKYPAERIEAACNRACQGSAVTYTMIKLILEKKLDTITVQNNNLKKLPEHDNIRGASAYN